MQQALRGYGTRRPRFPHELVRHRSAHHRADGRHCGAALSLAVLGVAWLRAATVTTTALL